AALATGEDLDLDLFALDAGYKLRVDGSLSLTHVIPAARLSGRYISELLVANLRSSWEIDSKWRARFGRPIFDYLHTGRAGAALRAKVFQTLSPLSVKYRLKRRIWEEIDRLRRADREEVRTEK